VADEEAVRADGGGVRGEDGEGVRVRVIGEGDEGGGGAVLEGEG